MEIVAKNNRRYKCEEMFADIGANNKTHIYMRIKCRIEFKKEGSVKPSFFLSMF